MLAFIYDPTRIANPDALGASLGVAVLVAGVPPSLAVTLPEAGYVVARQTWAGLDVLPGPVTPAQIAALPDPGPDPAIVAAQKQTEAQGILDTLRTTPIDPVALDANLALTAAGLAIPDPPAADVAALAAFLTLPSPTAAQAIAAVQALIRALTAYPEVIATQRATIAVLADTIRYTLQR